MLALSYPIVLALLMKAMVLVVCLAVPDFVISVAPDKVYLAELSAALHRELNQAEKFGAAVDDFEMWPVLSLSGLAFFNALRTSYRASWRKSLAATMTVFVCAALLIVGIGFGLEYLTHEVQSLTKK